MSPGLKCIYCKSGLTGKQPREHVIPHALTAGFQPRNLTIGCVCTACNDYFGRTLDQLFVEDSILGPLRYRHELKKDTRRAPLPDEARLQLRYDGKLVELHSKPDGSDYEVGLVTQVGFPSRRKPEGQLEYFPLDALDNALSDPAIDHGKYHVIGQGGHFKEEALAALRARGLTPGLESDEHSVFPREPDGSPQTSIEVQFEMIVDRVIKRCMSKIGFNYLAFAVTEKLHTSDWLLRPDFDVVRDFVRQDDATVTPCVSTEIELEAQRHMGGETQVPPGHCATVAWSRHGADVEANISLFSEFSWRVTLSRSFGGVTWDLRSGHFWDFETRRVLPMTPAR